MGHFYARRFLNQRGYHAGAFVLAVVKLRHREDGRDYGPSGEVEITDCFNRVTLAFGLDESEYRNSIHKARVLAGTLTKFADAIEEAADRLHGEG